MQAARDQLAPHKGVKALPLGCGAVSYTHLDSVCTLEACCVEKKEKTADPAHITLAPGSVSLIVLK